MPSKPADELTVYEAADIIGRSHSQVTRYIAAGLLPVSRKIGSMYLIPRKAVDRFTPPPPGNPTFQRKKARRKSK